jgi:hypothetical protein
MSTGPALRIRRAARVIVVDPASRALMFRYHVPGRQPFWVTAGGECEVGESFADAARRELGWVLPGPGFYRIAIMDAEGALVAADVRVAPPGAPRAEGAVLRLTPAE